MAEKECPKCNSEMDYVGCHNVPDRPEGLMFAKGCRGCGYREDIFIVYKAYSGPEEEDGSSGSDGVSGLSDGGGGTDASGYTSLSAQSGYGTEAESRGDSPLMPETPRGTACGVHDMDGNQALRQADARDGLKED